MDHQGPESAELQSSAEDQRLRIVVGTDGFPVCSTGGTSDRKSRVFPLILCWTYMDALVCPLPPSFFFIFPVPEEETKDSPCRREWLKGDISVGSLAEPPDIGSVGINIPQKPGHCF